MKNKLYVLLSLMVVASMVLGACDAAAPKTQSVVFADPNLELLYQAALDNNPQLRGENEEWYRQVFFDWYAGDAAEQVYLSELHARTGPLVAVMLADVAALSNPPAMLAALTVTYGTYATVLMQAEMAANLNLPTIPLPEGDPLVTAPQSTTPPLVIPEDSTLALPEFLPGMDTTQWLSSLGQGVVLLGTRKETLESDGVTIEINWTSREGECKGNVSSLFLYTDQNGEFALDRLSKEFGHKEGPCTGLDIGNAIIDLVNQAESIYRRLQELGVESNWTGFWKPWEAALFKLANYALRKLGS